VPAGREVTRQSPLAAADVERHALRDWQEFKEGVAMKGPVA
jgi:hypothetical protein